MSGRWYAISLVCFSAFLMGCFGSSDSGAHPDVFPVRGTILIDGVPKPYVRVAMIPVDANSANPVATGMTNKEGKFELSTVVETVGSQNRPSSKKIDGAEPGEYYVSLSWLKPIRPEGSEPEFGDELLPAKYQDPAKSGIPELKVTIKEEENELPAFQISRR